MLIQPSQFSATSPFDLLVAASKGRVGVDRRWLRSLTERPEQTISDLERFGQRDFEADPFNLEQEVIDLWRHFKDSKALPFFVQHLRKYGEDTNVDVLFGIVALGEAAVDPLLALYEELGEENGGEVAFALAGLQVRDDRILNLLRERLDYDALDAAIDLALYGDPRAMEPIREMLAEMNDVPTSDPVRRGLEAALRDLESQPPKRQEAFDIFEHYPDEAGPDFEVMDDADLLSLLSEAPEAPVRIQAAKAFFNESLEEETAQKLLELGRAESVPEVRAEIWRALGTASDNRRINTELRARIGSNFAPVERAGALVALSAQGDSPQFAAVAQQLYQKADTRAAALEAMRRTLDKKYAKHFPAHLQDEDIETRRQAIWGVGYLEIAASAKDLREFFDNPEFREDALYAYALSASAKLSNDGMVKLLDKIDHAAGGLDPEEVQLVETALDERMILHGLPPVFGADEDLDLDEEELDESDESPEFSAAPQPASPKSVIHVVPKPGRNDLCPCGSGKKYKKCCGS